MSLSQFFYVGFFWSIQDSLFCVPLPGDCFCKYLLLYFLLTKSNAPNAGMLISRFLFMYTHGASRSNAFTVFGSIIKWSRRFLLSSGPVYSKMVLLIIPDNSWKLPRKALPADSSGETQKCIANVYKTLADGYLWSKLLTVKILTYCCTKTWNSLQVLF